MNHEEYVTANLLQQIYSIADNSSSGIWVDSNVIMYSSKHDKERLLNFTELRTIPEVVAEVRKRPTETSSLLTPFLEKATVVGSDSFELAGEGKMFRNVSACCSFYSPLTRAAIERGNIASDSLSPFANNLLGKATDNSTIFHHAQAVDKVRAMLQRLSGGEMLSKSGLEKLQKSWREYHNKRERGLRDATYLWTDELLVASAITDAFVNNCLAIILTNDWDPNVVMKQFLDNAIAASVDRETEDVECWWQAYADRCRQFDSYLHERHSCIAESICDNDLLRACQGGDVIIWQYPSPGIWFFSFDRTFIRHVSNEIDLGTREC